MYDFPTDNFVWLTESINHFMTFFRSLKATRYFCIFFAFHFINISIDAPDLQPMAVAEDLSINDQESLIEFVAEHLLGFEHLFPEADDDDNNSQSSGFTFYCIPVNPPFTFSASVFRCESVKYFSIKTFVDPHPLIDGSNPPPEMPLV